MQFTTSLLSGLALLAGVASADGNFTYPDDVYDTTARADNFWLAVTEVQTAAFAGRNVQLNFLSGSKGDLGVYVDPTYAVAEFVLKNGSLQIPSESQPYYAAFSPLPTSNGIIRKAFSFTTNKTRSTNSWELTSVSNDGLYGLLNNKGQFGNYNGFVICTTSKKNSYQVEYQSSKDGKNTKGCTPMALHTFMGPPY